MTLVAESLTRYDILLCGALDASDYLSRLRWILSKNPSAVNPLLLEFPTLGAPRPATPEKPAELPNERDTKSELEQKISVMSRSQKYVLWSAVIGQMAGARSFNPEPMHLAEDLMDAFGKFRAR